MSEVRVAQRLTCPADTVWALIGDFGGLQRWHPQVQQLDLSWEGRIRSIQYKDGGHAVERLDARNETARRYTYVLVDSSLPLRSCHSTLQVASGDVDDVCEVVWSSVFEVAGDGEKATVEAIRAMYAAGLGVLAQSLGMS